MAPQVPNMNTRKQKHREKIKKLTQETKVFSNGSCIKGKVGAVAVMFKQGVERQVLRKHVGDESQHTIYEAEVIRLTLAAELIEREGFIKAAIIRADNQAAI